jgi:endoglucanase
LWTRTTLVSMTRMSTDSSALVCRYNNTIATGRYYDKVISDTDGFKAWWATTAKLFASNKLVVFDTNNEYHDMDNALVARLNQAAIDGIRSAGATSQYIFVEGNSWSGAWHWVCG